MPGRKRGCFRVHESLAQGNQQSKRATPAPWTGSPDDLLTREPCRYAGFCSTDQLPIGGTRWRRAFPALMNPLCACTGPVGEVAALPPEGSARIGSAVIRDTAVGSRGPDRNGIRRLQLMKRLWCRGQLPLRPKCFPRSRCCWRWDGRAHFSCLETRAGTTQAFPFLHLCGCRAC
jgi:hypothetical protein